MPKRPSSVDAYIASAPKDAQAKLQEIRAAIISAAPNAEEKISYGMPYYSLNGRLAYFRLAKTHLGLYIPPPIIPDLEKELTDYVTAKSTIQFPLTKKLPITLIKKLVKARAKYNSL